MNRNLLLTTRALFGLIVILLFNWTALFAQRNSFSVEELLDPVLQEKLSAMVKDFRGDVGIYVRHLPTGRTAAIRADELFPTASMIKVSIMLRLFEKTHEGKLDYHASLVYRDSLLYPGDDILGSFRDSARIPLSQVVMLMLTMSDNTASLWCQALADSGQAINNFLERNGIHNTRVNSRTPGRRADWEKYGWGQTTPRDMCELLTMIRDGRAVSPDASEEMFRVLSRTYWDSEALSQIPPFVHTASKQGAVDESRSEVVLVNAPSGDYVFCVITKNQKDTSWKADNEGYVLLRNISRFLWKYFEPKSDWEPTPAIDKWW
jgi:beta-lactamase class A